MVTLKEIKKDNSPLINEKIRAPYVQLIAHDGQNVGVVTRIEALRGAQDANLDLVLISEQGKDGVPVVKIMDFGKASYERKKKSGEAKKHQKVIQVKEVKLRPKIGEHDYQTKIKQALGFLSEGKRVKFTLSFRGRENATREERGEEMFNKIEQTFLDNGFSDQIIREQDAKMGQIWSRIYFLKNK
jgi:translation initiation factor IF-3